MRKLTSSVFLVGLLLGASANAGNRSASDQIFNEPKRAGGTQIFLGFVELVAAGYVAPGLSSEARAVRTAELDFDSAKDLPTSEARRKATINAIVNNPDNYDFDTDVGNESELSSRHARRLERLRSAPIVSAADKVKAIKAASTNVAKAREAALKAAQGLGLVDKTVKVVRVGTSVLLVGDVVARIYIWNAMDANPTISPAATYIFNQLAE